MASRAIGNRGGRAVGARNCEAGPRPGDRGGGRDVGERARPRGRHRAFHQHAGFCGIHFAAGERAGSDACEERAVGDLVVERPALVRPERSFGEALQRFVELWVRGAQGFNLGDGEHFVEATEFTEARREDIQTIVILFVRQLSDNIARWWRQAPDSKYDRGRDHGAQKESIYYHFT